MLLSLIAALQTPVAPPLPVIHREFRGAWVATVDNIDWPSRKGLSAAAAKAELDRIIDRAYEIKLNALLFQVRPMADAIYPSKLEPWSEFLTGQQGKSPGWDPLAHAIKRCHEKGIELHAWFNPYRAWHSVAKSPPAVLHVSRRHPELVRKYGKQKWLDPGDPRVQDYSLRVMLDVVKRYDIDGVHIDDYFYPYPIKGTPFPDAATYKRYGKGLKIGDWRRRNVDRFVERLYKAIKKEKRWVRFGISPFGIYRPRVPKGIEAGLDQYAELYADARKWLRNGWCDYFTPQLYWSLDSEKQNFSALLNWWDAENVKGRHLWPGLAAYKMVEGPKWDAPELVDQITFSREILAEHGHVFFSAKYLVNNTKGIGETLATDAYAMQALIPASTWLDAIAPKAPTLLDSVDPKERKWWLPKLTADGDVVKFAWTHLYPYGWGPWVIGKSPNLLEEGRKGVDGFFRVAVVAIDRAGNFSPPLIIRDIP